MKISWAYSPELEAKRIVMTANKIANGFYRQNGFQIELFSDHAHPHTVWLPKLNYTAIPRFWTRVAKLNINTLPFDVPKELLISNLEQPKMHFDIPPVLIETIENLLGVNISKIEIYPTNFGTGASWNVRKSESDPVLIYLRKDRDIWAVAEAIVTSCTRHLAETRLDGNWHETEFLSDWLVNLSPLGKLLNKISPKPKNFLPTIKYTRLKDLAILQEHSERFYTELGLPAKTQILPKLSNLTAQEEKIWELLTKNLKLTTTFDQLADVMFASDEAFSLEAIVKAIQRLRTKLESQGITGSLIQTVRNEGYKLS